MENKETGPKLNKKAREFKPRAKPSQPPAQAPPMESGSKYFQGVLPQPAKLPPSILPPGMNMSLEGGKLQLPPGLPPGLQKMVEKAYEDGKLNDFFKQQMTPEIEDLDDLTEEEYAMAEQFLAEEQAMEMCPYYLEGKCKYGKKCAHFHPSDIDEFSNTVHFQGDQECGICMENVLAKDRQFGLLDGWEHAFCLDCIRNWRSTYIKRMSKEAMRACPLCRKMSYLVVPSSRYLPGGEAKEQLLDEYKEVLSEIPCQHFNYGDGECPFLNSCFYAHYTKDGKKFDYGIQARYLNEDGEFVVEKENDKATLADLIGL